METDFTVQASAVPLGIAAANVLKSLGYAAERDFHLWRGASGRGYLHSVFSLYACPEVVNASYLLVRLSPNGRRTILHSGLTASNCGSLNLAEIRRLAARLGANEVHVHQVAICNETRRSIDNDLSRPVGERRTNPLTVAGELAEPERRLHS